MSKRLLATTVALALTVTPFVMAQAPKSAEAAKAPRLTLTEPIKDFGTVPKGQKLDWSFEVKNTGTTDLEILAAKPTCGCTVADFTKVIKPGQSGKVTAHVDTTNFAGPIAKSVQLETNDPAAASAQVTITAIVKPYVEAHPAGFVRVNMLKGETDKQHLLIYSEETEPFEIVKVESPSDWIKAEVVKAVGEHARPEFGKSGQNQYRLDITVGGDEAKIGPIAEKIRIVTNSKHQPEYIVNVSGVVRPTFRVEPTGVNFGEVAPNDTAATRTIVLRSNNLRAPESFTVTEVESGVAGLTAAVKPTDKKGEYEVTLQVAKDAKAGVLEGNVVIHTTDRIQPTVTVPIKGSVK